MATCLGKFVNSGVDVYPYLSGCPRNQKKKEGRQWEVITFA